MLVAVGGAYEFLMLLTSQKISAPQSLKLVTMREWVSEGKRVVKIILIFDTMIKLLNNIGLTAATCFCRLYICASVFGVVIKWTKSPFRDVLMCTIHKFLQVPRTHLLIKILQK